MRSSFLTNNDIPVGYVKPPFPSLYWPYVNKNYNVAFLYDTDTIWKFSVYWCLIFNGGFYGATGLVASYTHRKKAGGLWLGAIYLLYGGVSGIVYGTIIGYLISSIYLAGLFSMSTWIPLCCAVVQIMFDVCSSYSMVGMIM